jgi:hypothetical protein
MLHLVSQTTTWAKQLRRSAEKLVDTAADKTADRLDSFNKSMNVGGCVATTPQLQREVDDMLAASLTDTIDAARSEFTDNNEYIHRVHGLPASVINRVRQEIHVANVTRSIVPWHRKAGSIGYRRIQSEAPFTAALYRSPVMLNYLRELTGKPIKCKADDDDHACTFYVYTEPGDHMGYHYDICGCEDGASYSLIIGVIDDSTQQLLVDLHNDDASRDTQKLKISTTPGTLIAFAGSKVWHGVSKLGKNQQRVTLGLAYAISDYHPPMRRLVKVSADTLFHFGIGGMVKNVRRKLG